MHRDAGRFEVIQVTFTREGTEVVSLVPELCVDDLQRCDAFVQHAVDVVVFYVAIEMSVPDDILGRETLHGSQVDHAVKS